MPRYCPRLAAFCALTAATLSACSSNPRPVQPSSTPVTEIATPAADAQPVAPPLDATALLLSESQRQFNEGRRQLSDGHLSEARAAFDRALDVLMSTPQGARVDARVREAFDQLVDQISGLETAALAAGDGFAEIPYEPASIDELLAASAFDGPSPATAPELTRTIENDLAVIAHDVPIPAHARVLAYVQLFTGRLRDWVQTGLQRGTRYLPMIQSVFRAEGLPLDLAYVPMIESAFNPNALSRAQAKGVWQFMRQTAIENGLRHDWYVDERADPEKSTLAAARYLRTLNKMFSGDWHLALASYNGGPGRVQRAIKRAGGAADFWKLSASTRFLPRETREYVPMILAAIIIARNPSQYGFDIAPATASESERVLVPPATDLRRLAEWVGSPVSDLRALNPELRRWTTPVKEAYAVRVPEGTRELIELRLAATPEAELSAVRWHTVKRGETLSSLAKRFKVSRTELAAANEIRTTAKLRAGQELAIPRTPGPQVAADTLRAANDPPSQPSESVSTYMVRRGDTLFSIAKRFGLSVENLKNLNGLQATRIHPGDRLTVAEGATATQ
ncbi:MAG: LysM peptidoglycan-binding domain-containing protein [Vicinamibacterales bacterium]